MRWRGGRRSNNVQDLRGQGGGRRRGGLGGLGGMLGGGGGGRRRMGGRKGGIGLLGIVIVVGIGLLMGGDLSTILGTVMGGGGQSYAPRPEREHTAHKRPGRCPADRPGGPGRACELHGDRTGLHRGCLARDLQAGRPAIP